MTQTRLSRELDDRETAVRPRSWQPASSLPEPEPAPGYSYRWVRVSTLNNHDPKNISAKLREGYEPVPIAEQPQFKLILDPKSQFKGNIEVGGLLLCKIPSDFINQRNEYFSAKNRAQMESVDNNFMRVNDKRMPLFRERTTEVKFGKGR